MWSTTVIVYYSISRKERHEGNCWGWDRLHEGKVNKSPSADVFFFFFVPLIMIAIILEIDLPK